MSYKFDLFFLAIIACTMHTGIVMFISNHIAVPITFVSLSWILYAFIAVKFRKNAKTILVSKKK